jgi:5-methylcytosine-specific restriction endonuclease McrA
MRAGTKSLGSRLTRLGYSTYAEYLSSEHWQDVRKRFYASKLFHGCCGGCGVREVPLEVHHRTYRRLGAEYLMDLVALCRNCHQAVHDLERSRKGKHRRGGLWGATVVALRKRRAYYDPQP